MLSVSNIFSTECHALLLLTHCAGLDGEFAYTCFYAPVTVTTFHPGLVAVQSMHAGGCVHAVIGATSRVIKTLFVNDISVRYIQ